MTRLKLLPSALLLIAALVPTGCEFFSESDADAIVHETMIIAQLGGKFAADEEVEVSVDGTVVGVVKGSGGQLLHKVDSGDHVMTGRSVITDVHFGSTKIKVLNGQTFRFTYLCNPVNFTYRSHRTDEVKVHLKVKGRAVYTYRTDYLAAGATMTVQGPGGAFGLEIWDKNDATMHYAQPGTRVNYGGSVTAEIVPN